MPQKAWSKPRITMLPLDSLVRRRNCTEAASGRMLSALAERIASAGRYPAIIVRVHPHKRGKYEVIDGHLRAEILRQLGRRSARCEIWPVDDDEADVLKLALNCLRRRGGAARRARQVRKIVRRVGKDRAAAMFAMTAAQIGQLLNVGKAPKPVQNPRGLDLRAMVFHVPAGQVEQVAGALRRFGAATGGRGEALVKALHAATKENG